jgi:hypothetical protein
LFQVREVVSTDREEIGENIIICYNLKPFSKCLIFSVTQGTFQVGYCSSIVYSDEMKNVMGDACSRYGEEIGAYEVLVWRPEGRPLKRPRRRWENNIKMNLQELELGHGLC